MVTCLILITIFITSAILSEIFFLRKARKKGHKDLIQVISDMFFLKRKGIMKHPVVVTAHF